MTRAFGLVLIALTGLILACGPVAASWSTEKTNTEVVVFAASSLTDAFEEIGARFKAANPGVKVTFNFASSSQLRTQLTQGAQADIFASANQAEMEKVKVAGLIRGDARTFAHNRLIVVVPKGNPGQIAELRDLAKPGLKVVTAAPEVPIGAYTQAMLEKMARDSAFGAEFQDKVTANIVSREPNVRQVVAKITLGEADAAVVYTSDVTPDVTGKVETFPVPDAFNTRADYPIAVTANTADVAAAEAFVDYVMSPEGQAILQKWGFLSPSADESGA